MTTPKPYEQCGMMHEYNEAEVIRMPVRLKTVRFAGKKWFIDTRLDEYRNVENPSERMGFREAWGKY
jgi:hypothetical protein